MANVTQARRSTVALKYAMAVSGLIMVGYLLVHMYGNLKIFQGQETFDGYLHGLRDLFTPYLPTNGALWILRFALLGAVLLHAYAAVILWARNRKAGGFVGGRRYQTKQNRLGIQRTYASFTMRWGGVTIALFLVFHILQMIGNSIHPGGASDSKYERVVNGFELWWVVLVYTLALIAVGFHLWHGFWSALATLGKNHSDTRSASKLNTAAIVIAVVIALGFLIPPYAIFFFGLGG